MMQPDVFLARCEPIYDSPSGGEAGHVARALRQIWQAMGLDPDNPLCDALSPGGFAVIKPNWVMDANPSGAGLDCLITHSSLIHAMLLCCGAAMAGAGRVVVGDCPLQGCDFPRLQARTHMAEIVAAVKRRYPDLDLEIQDWRLTVMDCDPPRVGAGKLSRQIFREDALHSGDHYVEVDLGTDSFLEDLSDRTDRFRVTMYKPSLMRKHHRPGHHQYLIRREPLGADLLINLAKMKTHEKAGLTGAMKNLVGLNGHKEYLPHHTKGASLNGGDAYCVSNVFASWADELYDWWWEHQSEWAVWKRWLFPKAYSALRLASRWSGGDGISAGSWSGNDTVWRTTLDLNHLVYFGALRPKHVLNIVDGVIAGEGEGPLHPTAHPAGVLLVGENPACIDAVEARLMGYSIACVPTVSHALHHRKSKFAVPCFDELAIHWIHADAAPQTRRLADIPSLGFRLPRNWRQPTITAESRNELPERTPDGN